jgi:hypothetical protein
MCVSGSPSVLGASAVNVYTSDKNKSWCDSGNRPGAERLQILPHFKVVHEAQMYVGYLKKPEKVVACGSGIRRFAVSGVYRGLSGKTLVIALEYEGGQPRRESCRGKS